MSGLSDKIGYDVVFQTRPHYFSIEPQVVDRNSFYRSKS